MVLWTLTPASWLILTRLHIRLDAFTFASRCRPPLLERTFFTTPRVHEETPSMTAMRKMTYPKIPLSTATHEDLTEEYHYENAAESALASHAGQAGQAGQELTPSMAAIRKQPYPDKGHLRSLYEDPTKYGYTSSALTAHITPHPRYLLHETIKQGRYEEAAHILQELTELGVEIEPAPLYAKAAREAIGRKELSSRERAEAFASWWMLIPRGRGQKLTLRGLLNRGFHPDIHCIAHFAKLVAAKGHAPTVAGKVIPIIVYCADLKQSELFLEDLRDVDFRYRATQATPGTTEYETVMRGHWNQCERWYTLAVNICRAAGRLSSAVFFLRTAMAASIPIEKSAYLQLVRLLRMTGNRETVELVSSDWDRMHGLEKENGVRYDGIGEDVKKTHFYNASSAIASRVILPGHRDAGIALERLFHTNPMLRIEDFNTLIDLYDLQGDTKALFSLRHRLFRKYRATEIRKSWLAAEMKSLADSGQDKALHLLFSRHFFAVGVPACALKWMTALQQEQKERLKERRQQWQKHQQPRWLLQPEQRRRAPSYPPRTPRRKQPPWRFRYTKLQPDARHTAFIWRSAVSRANNPKDVRRLYWELLIMAKAGNNSVVELSYAGTSATSMLVDARHFNVFLNEFFSRVMYRSACNAPVHMQELRIAPNLATCRLLVRGYATLKDVDRTVAALRLARSLCATEAVDQEQDNEKPPESGYLSLVEPLLEPHAGESAKHRRRILRKALRILQDKQT